MPDTPASPDTPDMPDMPDPSAALAAAETEGVAEAVAAPEAAAKAVVPEAAEADVAAVAPEAPEAPATPAAAPAAPAARTDLTPAACADLLKQHFPALFNGPPRPLKLRIQADINERAPGVFSKAALSAFFRRHTTSTAYLIALGKAASRFDLDGQPAGELSEEHRQLARDELARRRQITREREQQAQAQQRVQDQARQAEQAEAQRAQQQERQARLTLLRDFERTTLTMANFCVLKGLKPEALTPLLEQARKEAAEAPPLPPRFDDRRGPVDGRRDAPRRDGVGQDGPVPARRPEGRGPSQRDEGPRPPQRPEGPKPPQRPDDPRPAQRADGPRPAEPRRDGPRRGDPRSGGKPPGPRGGG